MSGYIRVSGGHWRERDGAGLASDFDRGQVDQAGGVARGTRFFARWKYSSTRPAMSGDGRSSLLLMSGGELIVGGGCGPLTLGVRRGIKPRRGGGSNGQYSIK